VTPSCPGKSRRSERRLRSDGEMASITIAATEGAVTPDSSWWDRAKRRPRPQPIEIRKRERLCTRRKGEHQITLENRPHGVILRDRGMRICSSQVVGDEASVPAAAGSCGCRSILTTARRRQTRRICRLLRFYLCANRACEHAQPAERAA